MEAAAARLGVQLIKQYPAKEQAELKVKVQISGSWFGGSLTPEEKRELYWAQANDSSEAHKFPRSGGRREQTCAAIHFLCESDVVDNAAHGGFWLHSSSSAILYVKVKRSCSRHLWARTDWSVPQYIAGVFSSSEAGLPVFGSLRQGRDWVGTGSGLGRGSRRGLRDWDWGPDER